MIFRAPESDRKKSAQKLLVLACRQMHEGKQNKIKNKIISLGGVIHHSQKYLNIDKKRSLSQKERKNYTRLLVNNDEELRMK